MAKISELVTSLPTVHVDKSTFFRYLGRSIRGRQENPLGKKDGKATKHKGAHKTTFSRQAFLPRDFAIPSLSNPVTITNTSERYRSTQTGRTIAYRLETNIQISDQIENMVSDSPELTLYRDCSSTEFLEDHFLIMPSTVGHLTRELFGKEQGIYCAIDEDTFQMGTDNDKQAIYLIDKENGEWEFQCDEDNQIQFASQEASNIQKGFMSVLEDNFQLFMRVFFIAMKQAGFQGISVSST